jgi:hypothetical protein
MVSARGWVGAVPHSLGVRLGGSPRHLDPETESHLLDTIADLVPERTVIVASHAEAVLARCSRVLVLGGPVAARFADVP